MHLQQRNQSHIITLYCSDTRSQTRRLVHTATTHTNNTLRPRGPLACCTRRHSSTAQHWTSSATLSGETGSHSHKHTATVTGHGTQTAQPDVVLETCSRLLSSAGRHNALARRQIQTICSKTSRRYHVEAATGKVAKYQATADAMRAVHLPFAVEEHGRAERIGAAAHP